MMGICLKTYGVLPLCTRTVMDMSSLAAHTFSFPFYIYTPLSLLAEGVWPVRLGYVMHYFITSGAVAVTSTSYYGQGSGGIFLDQVNCDGTESSLISCSSSGVGVHTCDHSRDAGVQCQGIVYYRFYDHIF